MSDEAEMTTNRFRGWRHALGGVKGAGRSCHVVEHLSLLRRSRSTNEVGRRVANRDPHKGLAVAGRGVG